MWWTNSLCTLANEDLGTLAEYDPLTYPTPLPPRMVHRFFDMVSLSTMTSITAHEKK